MDLILPFKIGDFTEAKSLVEGFRGAWFRSKINDMRVTESGHLEYFLEYVDYPEEATEWVRVFQKNPLNPASRKKKSSATSQIMLRPPFPRWYRGDQVPEHFSKSELIANVSDTWKVGDWVEWLSEDCYWTAKIVRLICEDVVEIVTGTGLWILPLSSFACFMVVQCCYELVVLPEPPIGEGGSPHLVNHKKLRPSLDWSIVEGWTVRRSEANGKCWYAARLIHPESDIEESNTDEELEIFRPTSIHKSADPSQQGTRSTSKRHISPSEPVQLQPPGTVKGVVAEPNRPSKGTEAPHRYPLRVRKFVQKAPRQK